LICRYTTASRREFPGDDECIPAKVSNMTVRAFENQSPRIAATAFVDPSALVIGDVEIGPDSSVWPMVLIRGDIHEIRIGARSNIQDGTIVHVTHASAFNPSGFPTHVGDDVTIGHQVILHGCTIKDRVLVGMGAVIMDGAVVEPDVVIGGGSLVPQGKLLESGFLYVGSPVRQVRKLKASELAFLKYSAGTYAELKERHRASLQEPD